MEKGSSGRKTCGQRHPPERPKARNQLSSVEVAGSSLHYILNLPSNR